MLLSFPLDPDASTTEIISDTIYSNSTTLDGRRFASKFVAKRKADCTCEGEGCVNSWQGSAKQVSIADVVKAAPRAVQPEWGFKVVNRRRRVAVVDTFLAVYLCHGGQSAIQSHKENVH